jgi:hypothetical protein
MGVAKSTAPHKLTIYSVAKHPPPEAMTLPMLQFLVEKPLCLIVGANASESRHDPGILMHPAKVVVILGT